MMQKYLCIKENNDFLFLLSNKGVKEEVVYNQLQSPLPVVSHYTTYRVLLCDF